MAGVCRRRTAGLLRRVAGDPGSVSAILSEQRSGGELEGVQPLPVVQRCVSTYLFLPVCSCAGVVAHVMIEAIVPGPRPAYVVMGLIR